MESGDGDCQPAPAVSRAAAEGNEHTGTETEAEILSTVPKATCGRLEILVLTRHDILGKCFKALQAFAIAIFTIMFAARRT